MANNTREKILDAALNLFSENGYAGTNIQSIADSVGIVKSALYRHFDSKEAIWKALIDMISSYYNERFGSVDHLPPVPKTTEELKTMSMKMLNFTIYDERIIKVRKILMLEQFRDETARDLATAHFLTGLESLFTVIFEGMIENGSIKRFDASQLAFEYTAPITPLIHWHDREPAKDKEIMEKIEKHISHFINVYGNKEKTDG